MSETEARVSAKAVITVHKYEPEGYDEPAEGPTLSRGQEGRRRRGGHGVPPAKTIRSSVTCAEYARRAGRA